MERALGTLELQPFDEDGLPMRLATEPGMLVALRADLLYRRRSVFDRFRCSNEAKTG